MVGTLRFAHPTKLPFTNLKLPSARFFRYLGGGAFDHFDRRGTAPRAFILALTLILGVSGYITKAWAAGAFAVGKCGAYGHAFDYPAEATARAAALKQCKGNCTAVTMNRACAALAVDMTNPCGPYGYAVKPKFQARSTPRPRSATNSAARNTSSAPGPATPKGDSRDVLHKLISGSAKSSDLAVAARRIG